MTDAGVQPAAGVRVVYSLMKSSHFDDFYQPEDGYLSSGQADHLVVSAHKPCGVAGMIVLEIDLVAAASAGISLKEDGDRLLLVCEGRSTVELPQASFKQ